MTYSHNRAAAGRNVERYAHPPHHNSSSGSGGGGYFSNRKNNQHRGAAWQRSSAVNNPSNTSRCGNANGNSLLTPNHHPSRIGSGTGGRHSTNRNSNYFNNHNTNNIRTNGIQVLMGAGGGRGSSLSPSTSPLNLTHFAGSKCFDAPAPTALPKPPQHWTSSSTTTTTTSSTSRSFSAATQESSLASPSIVSKDKLLDDFDTHNLKLLLNVQS